MQAFQQLLRHLKRIVDAEVAEVALYVGGAHGLGERAVRPQHVVPAALQQPLAQAFGLGRLPGREGGVGRQHEEPIAHGHLTQAVVAVGQFPVHAQGIHRLSPSRRFASRAVGADRIARIERRKKSGLLPRGPRMDTPALPLPFPALLAGIRVLDASRVLAGPFCGQILGDLGADVLKIERPGAGDETRGWGPPFLSGGPSAYYLSCNRNKRGLALDLAQPRGQDLFHDLVRKSDVVLENFRPDSAEKLGLSAGQLLAVNPRAIVCSISGFGRTGPLRDLPGYDFAIQALSGLMGITGPVEGPPCKVGVAVADVLTGLYASAAVLACLIARGKSGHGYAIDLALLDCAVAAQVNVAQTFLTRIHDGASPREAVPARQGNAHLQIVPYQLFAAADGWLVLAVGNDGQWQKFARAAAPHLAGDERFLTNPGRVGASRCACAPDRASDAAADGEGVGNAAGDVRRAVCALVDLRRTLCPSPGARARAQGDGARSVRPAD